MRRLQSTFRACTAVLADASAVQAATALVTPSANTNVGVGACGGESVGGDTSNRTGLAEPVEVCRALAPGAYDVRLTGATAGATQRVTVMR